MAGTVERRIRDAEDSIREAEYVHGERVSNIAVLAKLYHAMIYCLFALFGIKEIGSLTHADLIDRFDRELVREGVFDGKFLDALTTAYDLTHECDCAHMRQPDDGEIERLLPLAREFVGKVRERLAG